MTLNRSTAIGGRMQGAYFGLLQTEKPFRTLREQGTAGYLMIYNISGQAFFRYLGGEIISKAGDVVLLAPRIRHEYGAGQLGEGAPYVRLFAHFQPRADWQTLLQWPEVALGIRMVSIETEAARGNIERSLREAVAYGMRRDRRGEAFALNALERALLWCESEAPGATTPPLDPRVARALDYLTHNLTRQISIDGLAKHCGLSVSRFCWLFREGVRETPQRYLENLRINRARQLLRLTPNPIKEIAAESGYADAFYFSLRFKRRTGLSPRAYRQRYGNAGKE